jgi:hypothetical protein
MERSHHTEAGLRSRREKKIQNAAQQGDDPDVPNMAG